MGSSYQAFNSDTPAASQDGTDPLSTLRGLRVTMSYYEPSSLYALQGEKKYLDSLGDGDSGVENDWWGLLKTCQDCKLTVPELRDEIQTLKDEKYYLQAQKGFLHAQLDNTLTMNSKLKSEVTGLKYELRNKERENQELRSRVVNLEKQVNLKPEIPPPPPPPPPKSLFNQLRRNIIRKSKRAASVPNINALCAPGARLNNETLEAIKNKSYQLRPVRVNGPAKNRNFSGGGSDGEQNIGQILARRISMGYSTLEEDNISIKSYNSIRSGGSVESYDWANTTDNSSQKSNTLFVTVLQI